MAQGYSSYGDFNTKGALTPPQKNDNAVLLMRHLITSWMYIHTGQSTPVIEPMEPPCLELYLKCQVILLEVGDFNYGREFLIFFVLIIGEIFCMSWMIIGGYL